MIVLANAGQGRNYSAPPKHWLVTTCNILIDIKNEFRDPGGDAPGDADGVRRDGASRVGIHHFHGHFPVQPAEVSAVFLPHVCGRVGQGKERIEEDEQFSGAGGNCCGLR